MTMWIITAVVQEVFILTYAYQITMLVFNILWTHAVLKKDRVHVL
jgi:hypothetical protein